MSDVQRWSPFGFTNRGGSIDAKMEKVENGKWVKYDDYTESQATFDDVNPGVCVLCGAEGVVEAKKDEKRVWGQELPEVLVTVRFWDCPNCGEAYVDHEQSVETERQMFHAYTTMFIAFRQKLLEMLDKA
jgi:hypothetical protein